jgi:hypothetical protein
MRAELSGAKRRWAASAAGAIIVVTAVLFLLRVPSAPPAAFVTISTPARVAKPTVELVKPAAVDQALIDETVMHDQRPLFLPTERNVRMRRPEPPEAGRSLLSQDASRAAFGTGELRLSLPPPEIVAEKPAEVVLTEDAIAPLQGFGRGGAKVEPLLPHGAIVEILSTSTNRRVLPAVMLDASVKPPTERPWRPLEFLARVDAAGLAGPLTIMVRSDVEEVDRFFRNYLGETFRIGERLPPGSYRIIVGP